MLLNYINLHVRGGYYLWNSVNPKMKLFIWRFVDVVSFRLVIHGRSAPFLQLRQKVHVHVFQYKPIILVSNKKLGRVDLEKSNIITTMTSIKYICKKKKWKKHLNIKLCFLLVFHAGVRVANNAEKISKGISMSFFSPSPELKA